MRHEDDGTIGRICELAGLSDHLMLAPGKGPEKDETRTHQTIGVERGDQSLRMIMDIVGCRALSSKGVDVCIVSIHQDPGRYGT